MQVLWGIGGMIFLLAIAFLLSANRRAINPRTVIVALIIQIAQLGIRALIAATLANLLNAAIAGMLVG